MKTFMLALASSLMLLGVAPASADMHGDTQRLAEEKGCLGCHGRADDTPRAPGFASIAAKYEGGEMRGYLIDVVMTGGEDHWGSATMPDAGERPAVSRVEAERLVDGILGMQAE